MKATGNVVKKTHLHAGYFLIQKLNYKMNGTSNDRYLIREISSSIACLCLDDQWCAERSRNLRIYIINYGLSNVDRWKWRTAGLCAAVGHNYRLQKKRLNTDSNFFNMRCWVIYISWIVIIILSQVRPITKLFLKI